MLLMKYKVKYLRYQVFCGQHIEKPYQTISKCSSLVCSNSLLIYSAEKPFQWQILTVSEVINVTQDIIME